MLYTKLGLHKLDNGETEAIQISRNELAPAYLLVLNEKVFNLVYLLMGIGMYPCPSRLLRRSTLVASKKSLPSN